MMTCDCERISILESSSSFSHYKHAVHASWLNGMEARRKDRKSMESSISDVITSVKSPIPQTYHFHYALMTFKID